ncbi:ABC transporter ATP-binding protein [Staphylococcus aureus]|uniref:ABC transporter ATP-binding protein n=1 Tax=Staphylococcus aureus TaxID=1280 RepID=UPI00021AEB2D|nr:ABC transporter ATP-binding protein [Staphylococcus aureus]EGS81303.1 ABC transporter, ATP-binding protein [Staphylococcus aureus subsp. aureus 21235]MCQ1288825.1 ABC transporter ATP-binding protein [Staphylococcus aureus]MRW57549.1 ATP-binding cassette domain-containing protein [Staphylococcus aureus]MRW78385.1 ATP-binding cassette domain-containing protein [Staphylococcus aureus]NEF66345.1 ABC transporter ATP-binding protein [Staphylococcus aureus]
MTEPIISFKDFSFQYHSQATPTLQNINVDIYPGEKVLVVGASGSGKSTFANCINGLITFKTRGNITGELYINNQDATVGCLHERSNVVGTVLQDTDGQFIGLTAAEDMAFLLENNCVEQDDMKKNVSYWAEKVDMIEHLNHRPQDLSGGQKQRVSLGGILIHRTPILILDEPLANLDPATGHETLRLLNNIHEETKSTMIIVEHRLEESLDDTFDRVLLFKDGKIIANTTPSDLLKSSKLKEAGIREPLYCTALKYAEVDVESIDNLANLHEVCMSEHVKFKVKKWIDKTSSNDDNKYKSEPLLELNEVCVQYSDYSNSVLNNVQLNVYRREMLSIVGHNGAGKSTLAKAICGFLDITGNIQFCNKGFNQLSISERSEFVGYVMQNPNHMISEKMIYDEVALGLRARGMKESDIKIRVENVLKICGLYAFRNWPIAALSYGQKKRVTIASVLVLNPEIIILDEPTAGQDFYHYNEIMSFLIELNRQGKTIIMITHDMHLLSEYSSRTIVLSKGQVVADTTPVLVLNDKKICEIASLRQTSLFEMAEYIGISEPQKLVQLFINHDRKVRRQ